LKSFEPFLSRVENLDSSQIGECISQMPGEWCGPDPGKLNQLAETLYKRRRGIRQAIIDAKNSSLKPFPNWRETNRIARPRPDPWSKRVD
jgi:hypothetical protein